MDDTEFGRTPLQKKRNTNPWGLPLARLRLLLILHIPKQRSLFFSPLAKAGLTPQQQTLFTFFYTVIDAQTRLVMVERAVERLQRVCRRHRHLEIPKGGNHEIIVIAIASHDYCLLLHIISNQKNIIITLIIGSCHSHSSLPLYLYRHQYHHKP